MVTLNLGKTFTSLAAASALVVCFASLPANAQETINVEVNKAHLIQLEEEYAEVVLIANPQIADVAVESPWTIFVLGRKPGVTSLFILGVGGKEIIRAEVVVTAGGAVQKVEAAPEVEKTGPTTVNIYRSATPETKVFPKQ